MQCLHITTIFYAELSFVLHIFFLCVQSYRSFLLKANEIGLEIQSFEIDRKKTRFPRQTKYIMSGKEVQKLEIYGLINDVNFQRARFCAEVYIFLSFDPPELFSYTNDRNIAKIAFVLFKV